MFSVASQPPGNDGNSRREGVTSAFGVSKMNDSIEGAAAKNVIGIDAGPLEYSRSRNESGAIHIFPET